LKESDFPYKVEKKAISFHIHIAYLDEKYCLELLLNEVQIIPRIALSVSKNIKMYIFGI